MMDDITCNLCGGAMIEKEFKNGTAWVCDSVSCNTTHDPNISKILKGNRRKLRNHEFKSPHYTKIHTAFN